MSDRLPNGWRLEPLGKVARVVSGGTPSRYVPEFWEGGTIPWVTPTDLTGTAGRFLSETRERITERGLRSCSATLLPRGALLMTSRATLGEIRIAGVEVCTNQGFKSLVPANGTDGGFLYYQMLRSKERYQAFGIGSTFLEVNKRDTERFEVLLASPGHEQQRIAEVLATVDEAIEQTEDLIAKTQQIKAGLMHDLFTRGVTPDGQLRPPREEAPKLYKESPLGWIPMEWAVETFGSVTPDGAPICYGILQPGEYHHDGVPVVAIFNLNTDYDSLHRSSRVIESAYVRSRIREGDVLLSIKGSIGRADVTPPEFSGNISRDVARIRPRAGIQSLWLRYALESKPVQSLLGRISVGTTRQELSIGRLKQVQIAIPPEPEQDRIARRLVSSDANACGERAYLSKLERLKRGLMHDLLAGRVRVPVADAQKAAANV